MMSVRKGVSASRYRAAGLLAALLLFALSVAPAQAQRGGGRPGDFDFYVLALSWSPEFCDSSSRRSRQCDVGRGLGFVLHGLWPQYEQGFPSQCGAERFIPRDALAEAEGVYPDQGLARHEWRQHGTCSGLSPSGYFRAARTARDKVQIPEALTALSRDSETTPQAIEQAFVDANPGLRTDMISVQCRRGALQEVRICMTRDLRGFRSCPDVDRRSCRFGPIKVLAPR